MQIHLLGTRGSRPTPDAAMLRYGGDTACVSVSSEGGAPTVLLDAGTGITRAVSLLGGEPFRGSILLGHLHWDHIQGLPFFGPADRSGARVDVWMPAQQVPAEEALARFMSPPSFPITPSQLRGAWRFVGLEEGEHEIEGFRVLALEVPHKGGRTFGYRLERDGRSLTYISDHNPTALGSGPGGIGELHDAALRLARDVDLLIHDAQYTAEEHAAYADWGHSVMEYPIALGEAAGAARVLLFHHDPGHDDRFLDDAAADLPEGAEFAVQGSRVDL